MKNLHYKTDLIKAYFSKHRVRWEQFYKSERVMLERTLDGLNTPTILDIGCGCGGLGLALRDHFGFQDYTGIEINVQAAEYAKEMNPKANIICGDFLGLHRLQLPYQCFDVVISLSCIDWQLNFEPMLSHAWSLVKPGGCCVLSLRLTDCAGVNDMSASYQFINYQGVCEGERAPYVVLNASDIIRTLVRLGTSKVSVFGYFAPPSVTAVTPYSELCFAVLTASKPAANPPQIPELDLDLPDRIASLMVGAISTDPAR